MSQKKLMAVGGAALALVTGLAVSAPGNPGPIPDPVYVITHTQVPAVPVPTVPTVPDPTVPTVPDPTVPDVPAPTVPTVPAPTAPGYTLPNTNNSYQVMCEQGGLSFELKGGLLYLDPDTLQITSLGQAAQLPNPLGPEVAGVDIPDRYQAANCSEDGGRNWGHVLLDFYVPNFGESSGVRTGFESVVMGEQNSDEHYSYDEQQSNELETFMNALQELLAEPFAVVPDAGALVATPSLPTLPSPLYTIDVTYRGPSGEYIVTSAPGVIGIPSRIALVNYYGNTPEALLVSIEPSQTLASDGAVASSGFALHVSRDGLDLPEPIRSTVGSTLSCYPLEADVKVRLNVASPTDPGYPNNATGAIELGYQTIGLPSSPSGGHAPSSFVVKYEGSTATTGPTRNDFLAGVAQSSGCSTPGPINLVGRFQAKNDPAVTADDVDLAFAVKMPSVMNWDLKRKTGPDGRLMITSAAPLPITELAVSGRNKGKDLRASLAPVPEALTVCSHKGNQCNRPWRLDRNSASSFYITARDKNNVARRVTASYFEADASEHIDLVLTLSDVAYDFYIGAFSWKDGLPGVKGDYPKWFYFDTVGQVLTGYYHSGSNGKRLDIELPGENRAWGREMVTTKKKWANHLDINFYGRMSCSSGFSISTDLIGGTIGGWLLGHGFCGG